MGTKQVVASRILDSIVIPVFKNFESLDRLLAQLEEFAARSERQIEVVFVVDGSPDGEFDFLKSKILQVNFAMQVVEHSRNFGSFPAIRSGLQAARGTNFAVMSADLQEPTELAESFFRELNSGDFDIVVGTRSRRNDPMLSVILSRLFWSLFRLAVQPAIPKGGVDVFGCTKRVADLLCGFTESNSSLIGLLYWVGFNRVEIPYQRNKRMGSKSAWSLRKKTKYFADSIFSFTNLPLKGILLVGSLGILTSIVLAVLVLLSWQRGEIEEPGYTTIVLVQVGSTASTLFALGIIGTYLWRTYENTKGRPPPIIQNSVRN